MADRQQHSEALLLLGGMAAIGLVAYLATRGGQGSAIQLTQPPTQPSTSAQQSGPITTNTMAFDIGALADPLASIPSSAFGGSMSSPGQYVQLPSGTTVPFMPGIAYGIGSIIHYGDGTVQIL